MNNDLRLFIQNVSKEKATGIIYGKVISKSSDTKAVVYTIQKERLQANCSSSINIGDFVSMIKEQNNILILNKTQEFVRTSKRIIT